jgi:SAM-dependent methyltransferase
MRGLIKQPDGTEVSCRYYPDIFLDVRDFDHAKQIVISREGELSSETRWDVETCFTIDALLSFADMSEHSMVLDYGCGVGRLSKALVGRVDCSVVGVDMSSRMRVLASEYVNSPRFRACSSEELWGYKGKFDCAVAAWVLQHCLSPQMDLELIASVLRPGAPFVVLGGVVRKLPVEASDKSLCWLDDGLNIQELTLKHFNFVRQLEFPIELDKLNSANYVAMYHA